MKRQDIKLINEAYHSNTKLDIVAYALHAVKPTQNSELQILIDQGATKFAASLDEFKSFAAPLWITKHVKRLISFDELLGVRPVHHYTEPKISFIPGKMTPGTPEQWAQASHGIVNHQAKMSIQTPEVDQVIDNIVAEARELTQQGYQWLYSVDKTYQQYTTLLGVGDPEHVQATQELAAGVGDEDLLGIKDLFKNL